MAAILKTYADVPASLQQINDTLITRLARANRSDEAPDETTRRALWKHVFSDGWDTTCGNVAPSNKPKPPPEEGYAVYIGTFTSDLPPVVAEAAFPPAFRILSGYWGERPETPQPVLPRHREAGAPAYLRAKLNADDSFGITFELVDELGQLAHIDTNTSTITSLSSKYKNVLLDPEFDTIREARAKAMLRLDSAEIYTTTFYNLQWIIFWARNRLLKAWDLLSDLTAEEQSYVGWEMGAGLGPGPRLAFTTRGLTHGPVDDRSIVGSHEEDYGMLRKIVTCSEVIQELCRVEVLERRLGENMRRVLSNAGL